MVFFSLYTLNIAILQTIIHIYIFINNYDKRRRTAIPFSATKYTERNLKKVGLAWRKHDSLIRKVIEENPVGRWLPLGRPRLRWVDCVKRDAEAVEPNSHWQEIVDDRDRWQYVYLAVWSWMAETKEEKD